ncbi:hypothetical protein CRG98_025466 [Punica granatum]|uniref:Retropepsins domain-containing protein n=1 Tax=Punica granatum TaxID=22663 RepID=A0A2I0JD03_PUNGR|nr:hypothetical protein CRG98_025466 [Punica granatum]
MWGRRRRRRRRYAHDRRFGGAALGCVEERSRARVSSMGGSQNCPSAPKRGIKLVQQLESATSISLEKDDVESPFSLDKEASPASIATLGVLTDSDSDSDFIKLELDTYYIAVAMTEEVNMIKSVSHIPVSIFPSKYAKPIKVIAFVDIGGTRTIMNPKILSKECWKSHTKHFNTASSDVLSTHLISKPIKIQFFPRCSLITEVLGTTLPRKDIMVGWDIITRMAKLKMLPQGVQFK